MQNNAHSPIKGQGTIEYLVIIAIVVVLSLVVTGILISQTSEGAQISTTTKQIASTSSPISISEAALDVNGKGLVSLRNNSGGSLTITKVSVGGIDTNFSSTNLTQGDTKLFSLSALGSVCTCNGEIGKQKTCEVIIYSKTEYGLDKKFTATITVDCIANILSTDQTKVVQPDVVLTTPPVVQLSFPTASAVDSNYDRDFTFSATSAGTISSCVLRLNGNTYATISNPTNGLNTVTYSNIPNGSYDWNVSCTDSINQTTTAATQSFT